MGADDNFFELEGTSLIALQVATRLRAEFKVDLPLAAIFEAPTIVELARKVDELIAEEEAFSEADALLAEIESLSADEAELLLTQESAS